VRKRAVDADIQEFTANPSNARLTELLSALHALPNVLIVFNHPMWDLYEIGSARHALRVEEFMQQNGGLHPRDGVERPAPLEREPRGRALAARWNKLLISGGDRHGLRTSCTNSLKEVAWSG